MLFAKDPRDAFANADPTGAPLKRFQRSHCARRTLLALLMPAALANCVLFRHRKPAPAPAPQVHFVVGAPYQAGGVWRYPRAQFEYEETGLASELGNHPPPMTDGAPYDPDALTGAHPTLQLPSVVRVTNLETGLSVLVRLDDRGPEMPSRAAALSPRAWILLGSGSEAGVRRVRIEVAGPESLALENALAADRERLAISAAPAASVTEEALPPPPGVAGEAGGAGTPVARAAAAAPGPAMPQVPLRLPERVVQFPVRPTALYVDLGGFSTPRYARVLAARVADLGARVVQLPSAPRDQAFRVRVGPLATAAEADAALDRTLGAGVSGARIVVDEE